MATLYSRLVNYCQQEKLSIPEHQERAKMGSRLVQHYFKMGYSQSQYAIYQSIEPEGTYRVINYPDSFTPHIDSFIHLYFNPKPKRKRVPARKPAFSGKQLKSK